MSIYIPEGGLFELDRDNNEFVIFNWDEWTGLPDAVELASSTFTIDAIKQSGVTALTKDNPSVISGNRKTQVRLLGSTATVGDSYWLRNTVVTNETPAQTFDKRVKVKII